MAFAASGLLFTAGCDKLRAAAGGGGEGGAGSGGGPSIIGDIFTTEFEGEITSKMTNASTPGKQQLITFGIKRPKYRVDMTDPSAPAPQMGSVILDVPTKKGWILVHPQKMAMPLDLNQPRPQFPGMPGAPKGMPAQAPSTPPKVEKTGKKDIVAGYSCEIWNITSDNNKKSEVCMAENLTWIDISDMGLQSPEVALSAVTTGGNHFPLRVITRDATGKEETRMEAQKVDKKTLDDTRFAPPPDYKQFNPGQIPSLPNMPAKPR